MLYCVWETYANFPTWPLVGAPCGPRIDVLGGETYANFAWATKRGPRNACDGARHGPRNVALGEGGACEPCPWGFRLGSPDRPRDFFIVWGKRMRAFPRGPS
eukprot:54326-Pyramimonas_sp.AAC.1